MAIREYRATVNLPGGVKAGQRVMIDPSAKDAAPFLKGWVKAKYLVPVRAAKRDSEED